MHVSQQFCWGFLLLLSKTREICSSGADYLSFLLGFLFFSASKRSGDQNKKLLLNNNRTQGSAATPSFLLHAESVSSTSRLEILGGMG